MSATPTHVEIRLEEPKPSFWKRILCCCCHRRKSKRLDMKRLEEPDANAQEPNAPNAPNAQPKAQPKAQDEEMKVLTLTDEDQTKAQDEEAKEEEDPNVVIVEVVESNVVEEVKSKAEEPKTEPKEQAEVKAKADKAIEEPKTEAEVKAKADKAIEEPKTEAEVKAEEPKAEEPKTEEPTNAKKRTASFYKNKKKNKNQKIQTNVPIEAPSDSSSSEAPLSPEYVVVSPQAPKNPNK